LKFQA